MKTIKILLTACGRPEAPALINALHNVDRKLIIVGTDVDPEAGGRFLCDYFYTVPEATALEYTNEMLKIVNTERPFVILPGNGIEAEVLADNARSFQELNAQVLASPVGAVGTCNNKWDTYQGLKRCTDLIFPEQHFVNSASRFMAMLAELGYPDVGVVVKPADGLGRRGVRIIDPDIDHRKLLEGAPDGRYITMARFMELCEGRFPQLIVQEYIDEPEECVDCLCLDGKLLLATVRTRNGDGSGEQVHRPALVHHAETAIRQFGLSWCVSLQFIGGKLIHINPRICAPIYQDDLNQAYLAIQLALGLITEEDIWAKEELIQYGLRFKYLADQVTYGKEALDGEQSWTDTWSTGTASAQALAGEAGPGSPEPEGDE